MKTVYWFICLLVYSFELPAQTVQERLELATQRLLADPQLKHAILGLSVVKSETGEKIVEINAEKEILPVKSH